MRGVACTLCKALRSCLASRQPTLKVSGSRHQVDRQGEIEKGLLQQCPWGRRGGKNLHVDNDYNRLNTICAHQPLSHRVVPLKFRSETTTLGSTSELAFECSGLELLSGGMAMREGARTTGCRNGVSLPPVKASAALLALKRMYRH